MINSAGVDISKIDVNALYSLGGSLIEPVEASARSKFRYWRCASLARIMLNYAQGFDHINAGPNPVVHFTDDYEYASKKVSHVVRITQWTQADSIKLAELSGHDPLEPLPLIVVALDERFNSQNLRYRHADGLSSGYVYDGYVSPSMLDPYSQATIAGLQTK